MFEFISAELIIKTDMSGKPIMAKWTFEPEQTAAVFSVCNLVATTVRGHFQKAEGKLGFYPDSLGESSVAMGIDATDIWTRKEIRDSLLGGANFLDVENYPEIIFKANQVKMVGAHDLTFTGNLTIHGVTRKAALDVTWLGSWETHPWGKNEDKESKNRAGFVAKTTINSHDFDMNWNDTLEKGGMLTGDMVELTIDAANI